MMLTTTIVCHPLPLVPTWTLSVTRPATTLPLSKSMSQPLRLPAAADSLKTEKRPRAQSVAAQCG
jgi:hypothetical protein